MAPVPALEVRRISKSFVADGGRVVLEDLDMEVAPGSLTAILGPSGGGKTTLLRVICGLETADSGSIRLFGREVAGPSVLVPPEARRVGIVFQDYALFPHLSALRNVAFGVPGPAGLTRAWGALQLLGLSDVADRRPERLSGGEQQRVALARALAPEPSLLLLDEPFSNLDASLRAGVRSEVASLLRRLGTTAVLVTHDREEAFSLADQVVLLLDGRIRGAGRPEELALRPVSREAARFLGETNLLPGTSDGRTAACELGRMELVSPVPAGPVEVLLPLDRFEMEPFLGDDHTGAVVASLTRTSFHGPYQLLSARLPSGREVAIRSPARETWQGLLRAGQQVGLSVRGPVTAFPPET